jgi:ribokinase
MVDIVVVGSLNMDLVVRVAKMPLSGETVVGSDLALVPGGKGANQAVAAAKQGLSVSMVGCVGNDPFGPRLIQGLKEAGVSTDYIRQVNHTSTGTALIFLEEGGDNRIVISPGANGQVSQADIDRTAGLIQTAKIALFQFEIPMSVIDYGLQMTHRFGVATLVNPAPYRPFPSEWLSKITYLVPNESEAWRITGIEVTDLSSAQKAAEKLLKDGASTVILTLGEMGALLATPGGVLHVPAPEVEVVDTTAAGDSFIGGLSAALVWGYPIEEAVRYAVCAGTLAVTKFGAQTSIPSLEETRRFYEAVNKKPPKIS